MYLRHTVVRKGGRAHTYWRLVRSVRRGAKVVQETVAQLGELDGEGCARAGLLGQEITGRADQRELFDRRVGQCLLGTARPFLAGRGDIAEPIKPPCADPQTSPAISSVALGRTPIPSLEARGRTSVQEPLRCLRPASGILSEVREEVCVPCLTVVNGAPRTLTLLATS